MWNPDNRPKGGCAPQAGLSLVAAVEKDAWVSLAAACAKPKKLAAAWVSGLLVYVLPSSLNPCLDSEGQD